MIASHVPEGAASIIELLQHRAASMPDRVAFQFLIDGEVEGPRLTFAELDARTRAIAVALASVAEPGDRALLLYAPGLDFVPAFYACHYAGVIPVPAYPPRLDRLAQSWETLGSIAADCQPKVVLSSRNLASLFAGSTGALAGLGTIPWLCTDEIDTALACQWQDRPIDPGDVALLQYTSGSTASPKGVIVTHRSLMNNLYMMQEPLGSRSPGLGVTWLPLYHDLGLIGGVVQLVFQGTTCVMMSPLAWLQKPARWLQAMSRYGGGVSGAPNFAYELCAERVTAEQKEGLDLSRWWIAAVGGEPINPRTLDRFTAAFAPYGFRPEAFVPCYGLAEATLFVTRRPAGDRPVVRVVSAEALERGEVVPRDPGSPDGRAFVSCGRAWLGQRVEIVDPETRTRRPAGTVGEIWVAGESVASGYWGQPEATEHTFQARLSDTGEGPFLRTGDLGFFDDGDLFVTGRLKDLIIVRGRNHNPEDIEQTVQSSHPGLRQGCGAAFETRKEDRSVLVVVQEVERGGKGVDPARVVGDIRQAVAERHDVQLQDVQLLEFGSIPRTSSGKVQRHRCRLGYEQGTLRAWKGMKS